jgi:AraC-like DNA-binding protein
MHFVLALSGRLKTRPGKSGAFIDAAGVLTAPDAVHAIDARGVEVLLVFLDPESDAGAALASALAGAIRPISDEERAALVRDADPRSIILGAGADWIERAVRTLGAQPVPSRRRIHPRVRKLLRSLHTTGVEDLSLEGLAGSLGMSQGRLMHVFTESIGIPLRPYVAWLKLQRAAGAIVSGAPLSVAAHAAGFADAAHMTRTFRRMFGVAPSSLRPPRAHPTEARPAG